MRLCFVSVNQTCVCDFINFDHPVVTVWLTGCWNPFAVCTTSAVVYFLSHFSETITFLMGSPVVCNNYVLCWLKPGSCVHLLLNWLLKCCDCASVQAICGHVQYVLYYLCHLVRFIFYFLNTLLIDDRHIYYNRICNLEKRKGWERATVSQTNIETVSEATVGTFLRDMVERIWAFLSK